MTTQNLGLPFIAPAQAQKHITVNTAFQKLDIAVNIAVLDIERAAPPLSPNQGDRYAISENASGDWTGHEGEIAALQNNVWEFFKPQKGTLIWDEATQAVYVRRESGWQAIHSESDYQNLPQLGVGAEADSTNRLAVASPASLFNHNGNGHQLKINRAADQEVGSVLFQTNFEGEAEIGLTGESIWALKLKQSDGAWRNQLTAKPDFPGVNIPMLNSGQITIGENSVAEIATPQSGGVIAIMLTDDGNFPQASHSAIFAYDTGSSMNLQVLCSKNRMMNLGTTLLTGSSGEVDTTSISAKEGALMIENRSTGMRTYRYTFLV